MKNKWIGLSLCVGFIIAGLIASFLLSRGGFYHQHREETNTLRIKTSELNSDEWVVHKTTEKNRLLGNYVFCNIAGDICGYAPITKYAIDENNNVVQLRQTVNAALDGRAQFIVCIVHKKGEAPEGIRLNTLGVYRHFIKSGGRVVLTYPDDVDEKQKEEIRDELSYFEKTLYSFDYKKNADFIDSDSFIRYFIITELAGPKYKEKLPLYLFKNKDGKYEVCISEFSKCAVYPRHDFFVTSSYFYTMLFRDSDFVDGVVNEYHALRKGRLSNENLEKYISESSDFVNKYYFQDSSVDKEEKALKEYVNKRLKWMDDNIESLYQYSARSNNKAYSDEPF